MEYLGFSSPEARAKRKKKLFYELGDRLCDFFWDDGPNKYGFEYREGQQEMAFEILDALSDNQHIAIEAAVGIGKSFAYLVPLLLLNHKTGAPIIISTSTIALQEQLLRDVGRLMKLLSISTEVTLAKGQTHYLCRQRYDDNFDKLIPRVKRAIKEKAEKGVQNRSKFDEHVTNTEWDKINIQRFSKRSCQKCKYREVCEYYLIRECILITDGIVICNQDFLTAHLIKIRDRQDGLINESAEVIVVDEAHNLENKVRSITTKSHGISEIEAILHGAQNAISYNYRALINKECAEVLRLSKELFNELVKQVQSQIDKSPREMKYAERFFLDFKSVKSKIVYLSNKFSSLAESVQLYVNLENGRSRGSRNTQAVDDLIDIASSFSNLTKNDEEILVWLEGRGKFVKLVYCPKQTEKIMSELYFNKSPLSVLTSATLASSSDGNVYDAYSYFVQNTGFPYENGGRLSLPKPSPFPYDKHALIYYCDDLPHPRTEHELFIEKGSERLIEVLSISRGKALVLFTSKTDMEEVWSILNSKELPFKVLIQQSGSSQDSTLSEFRENTHSVLLGTGAFWEGISIEGETLSNLIIFRLPFPVPDPIIEYKNSKAENSLMEVSVPEMIISLKQGIGRLIRNFTDKGIVTIIDSRLKDIPAQPYRDKVWNSIPIKNRTNSLAEAKKFYERLDFDV